MNGNAVIRLPRRAKRGTSECGPAAPPERPLWPPKPGPLAGDIRRTASDTRPVATAQPAAPTPEQPIRPAAPELRRELGFWELTASGVGIIVGAGIYVLIGTATAEAGAGVWLAFLIAAVLSALTGMSYCELAALYPRAGAEYEYTRHAFPGWVAFLVGWVMMPDCRGGGRFPGVRAVSRPVC